MSYARFGWQGSDVYVYEHTGGYLACCGCLFASDDRFGDFRAYSHAEMIEHLDKHRAAGHTVPESAMERLREEMEKRK